MVSRVVMVAVVVAGFTEEWFVVCILVMVDVVVVGIGSQHESSSTPRFK